jgi:hypothetical protein
MRRLRRHARRWLGPALATALAGCGTPFKCQVVDARTGTPLPGVRVERVHRGRVYAPFLVIPVMAGGHLRTNDFGVTDRAGRISLWPKRDYGNGFFFLPPTGHEGLVLFSDGKRGTVPVSRPLAEVEYFDHMDRPFALTEADRPPERRTTPIPLAQTGGTFLVPLPPR